MFHKNTIEIVFVGWQYFDSLIVCLEKLIFFSSLCFLYKISKLNWHWRAAVCGTAYLKEPSQEYGKNIKQNLQFTLSSPIATKKRLQIVNMVVFSHTSKGNFRWWSFSNLKLTSSDLSKMMGKPDSNKFVGLERKFVKTSQLTPGCWGH